jgi:hypothetical protein
MYNRGNLYFFNIEKMEHTKQKQNEMLADYDFKSWTKENLRNDGKFSISDIDSVIRDTTDKGITRFQLIEKKCFNAEPRENQAITYRILHELITKGIDACNGEIEIKICGKNQMTKVEYLGTHLLQLSDATFDKSEFKFDRKPVSLKQLVETLNFENHTST